MNPDTVDTIIETIEVFINSVLSIRKVYPEQIFQKRKIYNTSVYISIYPPLNDYILNVLITIKKLIEQNVLTRIEVIIYRNEFTIYETYVFEIDCNYDKYDRQYCNRDKYLIDFEEQLRRAILTLEDRSKILGNIPKDAKFKVNIQTTQSAFVKFSNDYKYQNFPWLQETENSFPNNKQLSILPITAVDSVGLKLYVEKY